MSVVLKNQIEASEKSAQTLEEQLLHEHRCALLSFEVRDLAKSLVSLFRDMNDDVAHWQQVISDANGPAPAELMKLGDEWDVLYRRLSGIFEKGAHLIREAERLGPEVDGKLEFFKAWRELRGIVCFSRSSVAIGAEQARRNEARPLGEITRALYSGSDARG
jgi:hypothetical protein